MLFTSLKTKRPSKCQRRTDRTTMLLVAVLMLFLITEFPQGILGLLSGLLERCFFLKCYVPFAEMMDLLGKLRKLIICLFVFCCCGGVFFYLSFFFKAQKLNSFVLFFYSVSVNILALINAAVGFVLYGLMSRQFRSSFKSVFFNKRLSRLEMTRITNTNNTTCVWRRLNLGLFIVT